VRIDGRKIAEIILSYTRLRLAKLKNKKLCLSAVYIGKDPDQLGYLKKKENTANLLGIKFNLIHIKNQPSFEEFATVIRNTATDPKTTGVIIQQPLPPELQTNTIYDFIPNIKEIEGFSPKSPFYPPIGLAVLTILKYIYLSGIYKNPEEKPKDLIIYPEIREKYLHKIYQNPEDAKLDKFFFKDVFADKKIVLVGRGLTGGKPAAFTLNEFGINFLNVNSATPNPENFYKQADIIISAVGKKILKPEYLKEGAILISIGQHKQNGQIQADYDEQEIKDIAKFYTPAAGGVGPVNIAYIYKNLVESALLQEKKIKF